MDCESRLNKSSSKNGQVLYIVLVILFILTAMITLFALFFNFRYRLIRKEINKIKARYVAESGIELLLSLYQNGETVSLEDKDIFDNGLSKCSAELLDNPGYLTVISTGIYGKEEKIINVKYAGRKEEYFNYAVYSDNTLKPLVIQGKECKISGGVSSQKSIFVKNNAEVDVKHYSMQSILKKLDTEYFYSLFDKFNKYFKDKILEHDYIEPDKLDFQTNKTVYINTNYLLESPFEDKVISIKGPGTLIINGNLRVGDNTEFKNIKIIVNEGVVITGNAIFSNCMIYSNSKCFLTGKVKFFNTQIFSNSDIFCEKKASFNGNSILCIKAHKSFADEEIGNITLIDEVCFYGTIIILPFKKYERRERLKMKLHTGKDTYVNGGIINFGTSEITGRVDGFIYSGNFLSGYDENTLKDVIVDNFSLSELYELPVGFTKFNNLKIIQYNIR